jgi:predicted  nucleic acid-binding Zn-ribbon protein
MTQSTEPNQPTELRQVLDSISELRTEVTGLKTEFTDLKNDVEKFNDKFDNYQKATQSVVNLAFGLIASATIVTLASAIFRR